MRRDGAAAAVAKARGMRVRAGGYPNDGVRQLVRLDSTVVTADQMTAR